MRWYVEHSAQSSSLIHVNVYGRWCLVAAKNGKTHLNSSAVSTDEFRESVRICAHWFHTPSYLIQTACCKGDPNIYILHKPNPSFQSQNIEYFKTQYTRFWECRAYFVAKTWLKLRYTQIIWWIGVTKPRTRKYPYKLKLLTFFNLRSQSIISFVASLIMWQTFEWPKVGKILRPNEWM